MEDTYPEKIDHLLNMRGKIYNYIRKNWYRDPPLTSEDIQKEFGISKTTASEHLTDLERNDIIERKNNEKGKKDIFPKHFSNFFL